MNPSDAASTAEPCKPDLSIVLPCFNEAHNIPITLSRLACVAGRMATSCEVVVVDDGSSDGTSAAAALAARDLSLAVRVVRRERNGGYGAAVRTGIDAAAGRYILLTDGDGQFSLGELPDAMRSLACADAVLGYRRVRRDPWRRRLMGRCWTLLVNLCLFVCVRDVDCAFKLVPSQLLKRADLRSRGALISTEIVAALVGSRARIVQQPVEHLPRRTGRATGANPRVVLRAFVEMARNLPRLGRVRSGAASGPWRGSAL